MRLFHVLAHREIKCLKGKAAIYGARFFSRFLGRLEHT